MLTLAFHTDVERTRYGKPVVQVEGQVVSLADQFARDYADNTVFKEQVQDLIETGLYLARHRHSWRGELVTGALYSRKDVCRLLNWELNEYSTIYGYKVDYASGTCPIFVTYHKHEDVADSVRYGDEFRDRHTLHWYTRSRRTMQSQEVRALVNHEVTPHVFVKKDDAEGVDFFCLGVAESRRATDATMPNAGGQLNVVTMDLSFKEPVDASLYDHLVASRN